MPTPLPVGRVRYTLPRAASVRAAGDIKTTKASVNGTIAISTDTVIERDKVLNNWEEIMQAINTKVVEILLRQS